MADQENKEILRNLHQALQPMIRKLQDRKTRASALSSLANHLQQLVTNEEAEMFNATCIFLFYSVQTMGILEECMAAAATYPDLVLNGYCNHLPRMIAFFDEKVPEAIHEDIQERALLVIELLCKTGMRILEVLLEDHLAIAHVGSPHNKSLLYSLVSTWDQMTFLAFTGILLHIFRCCDLLCTIRNGLAALKDRSGSLNFMRAAAHTMLQDHPEIRTLIGQVLHSLSGEDCRSLQYFHPESGNQIGFH